MVQGNKFISNKAIVKPCKDLLLNTVFHDQCQSSAAAKNNKNIKKKIYIYNILLMTNLYQMYWCVQQREGIVK